MPAATVKPQYRPTAFDLLGRRFERVPAWIRILVAVIVVGALAAVVIHKTTGGSSARYVHQGDPVFNFRYTTPALKEVRPRPGEYVRIEGRRGGLFTQSFTVGPMDLPAYRGDVSAYLPLFSTNYMRRRASHYQDFEYVEEGRARVNGVPGYDIVFRARLGKRRLLGRLILLPDPVLHPTRGVVLELLNTPASGVATPDLVGFAGAIKTPYRSFRYGTATSGLADLPDASSGP